MIKLYDSIGAFCSTMVTPLANLWARIYMGWYVFFSSGLAKLDDFEETIELFAPAEDGEYALPFLSAEPAAYLATIGELVLPILLILGLFTRFSAFGLLIMSVVIQVWVFQLDTHYFWMIIFVLLIGQGGHKISLDNWLLKLKQ